MFFVLLLMTAFTVFSQNDRYCFTRSQAERLAYIKKDYIRLLNLSDKQDRELSDVAIDLKIANYVILQQKKEIDLCEEKNTFLGKKNDNLEVIVKKTRCTFWKKLGIGTVGVAIGAGLYAIFENTIKNIR